MQLRAFVAVCRCNSFTLAADALHRTQAAVSLQVRQLEKEIGLKLIDRSTRQLHLTPVGAALVPPLSALLDQLDAVLDVGEKLRAKQVGIVRIGCLPSTAASYIPRKIAAFRKRHPGIDFIVRDSLGAHIVSMVRNGEVEFGVTDTPHGSDLVSTPLFVEQMCVLYPRGHAIAKAQCVDVTELSKHKLILMTAGSNSRRIVDAAFASAGLQAVPTCEVTHMTSAVGLVQAGLGVALLPRSSLDFQKGSAVDFRLLHGAEFSRQISVVKLRQLTLSPAASSFVRTLIGHRNVPK